MLVAALNDALPLLLVTVYSSIAVAAPVGTAGSAMIWPVEDPSVWLAGTGVNACPPLVLSSDTSPTLNVLGSGQAVNVPVPAGLVSQSVRAARKLLLASKRLEPIIQKSLVSPSFG